MSEGNSWPTRGGKALAKAAYDPEGNKKGAK